MKEAISLMLESNERAKATIVKMMAVNLLRNSATNDIAARQGLVKLAGNLFDETSSLALASSSLGGFRKK